MRQVYISTRCIVKCDVSNWFSRDFIIDQLIVTQLPAFTPELVISHPKALGAVSMGPLDASALARLEDAWNAPAFTR